MESSQVQPKREVVGNMKRMTNLEQLVKGIRVSDRADMENHPERPEFLLDNLSC